MKTDTRFWITLAVLIGFAVFLLWEEHQAHILSAGIWLLILACPLLHVFMHGGHGHGGHGNHSNHDKNGH